MAICKKCGKDIRFIKLASGKWHPVDLHKRMIKIGEGNISLITEAGEIIKGRAAGMEDGANGIGFSSHFSTCS